MQLIRTVVMLWFIPLAAVAQSSLVNFAHLQHLTERILFQDDSVDIVHVYAEYPTYEWVDAKESGPEGIACVDDAARAAVVYLRHYELTNDRMSLRRAVPLLRFVMKMQADDGQFYNFLFADHSINTEGKTSVKSFGWWAARAVWAMALGYRVLSGVDPALAAELRQRVEATFPHIEHVLTRFDSVRIIKGYCVPRWLLYESAADATSELLLGLLEHYAATHDKRCSTYIERFALGLSLMQNGSVTKFPYGLHRSWETIWHMWGNSQTQALAQAGTLLGNRKFTASAELEGQAFYSRLLIHGFMKEMDVTTPDRRVQFEQIAYGVRPMAVGLIRLYEATNKPEYLKMAGLAASWFSGNNAARQRMYDPQTGRCFDGINDSLSINMNSGAESTIEALLTLVELEKYPSALRYLHFRKVREGATRRYLFGVFQNTSGDELTLAIDVKRSRLLVFENDTSRMFLQQVNE